MTPSQSSNAPLDDCFGGPGVGEGAHRVQVGAAEPGHVGELGAQVRGESVDHLPAPPFGGLSGPDRVPDLPVQRQHLRVDRPMRPVPGGADPGLQVGEQGRIVGRQPQFAGHVTIVLHERLRLAATRTTSVAGREQQRNREGRHEGPAGHLSATNGSPRNLGPLPAAYRTGTWPLRNVPAHRGAPPLSPLVVPLLLAPRDPKTSTSPTSTTSSNAGTSTSNPDPPPARPP